MYMVIRTGPDPHDPSVMEVADTQAEAERLARELAQEQVGNTYEVVRSLASFQASVRTVRREVK